MAHSDHDFYRARAKQEYARAECATNACARTVHLELARLYLERLDEDALIAFEEERQSEPLPKSSMQIHSSQLLAYGRL